MSFVTRAIQRVIDPGAKTRKRAAQAAEAQAERDRIARETAAQEQARIAEEQRVAAEGRLAEEQRLQAIEQKKADEIRFATREGRKRKLRRAIARPTIINVGGPLGIGTGEGGKTFLGA